MHKLREHSWRIFVGLIGGTVVAAGVAMLVLPGPGWLTIILGLGILSTEFTFARKMLHRARRYYEKIKRKVVKE